VPLTNAEWWGCFVMITRLGRNPDPYRARFAGRVGVIPCVGGRDPAAEERLKAALARGDFTAIRSLRRAPEEPDETCWLAGEGWWLSTAHCGEAPLRRSNTLAVLPSVAANSLPRTGSSKPFPSSRESCANLTSSHQGAARARLPVDILPSWISQHRLWDLCAAGALSSSSGTVDLGRQAGATRRSWSPEVVQRVAQGWSLKSHG
jgi:hypothetical protein